MVFSYSAGGQSRAPPSGQLFPLCTFLEAIPDDDKNDAE